MLMMMIITVLIATAVSNLIICLLLRSVPAGDCGAAGEAAGLGTEAGRV